MRKDRVKMARPDEKEAVRTTIVGGRPPGSGKDVGDIPRGIEVLVKKASVDPEFKDLLLEKRADAAREISLDLTPPEAAMLNGAPRSQLEAIINNTKLSPKIANAFLGKTAVLMLAALGVSTAGCCDRLFATRGIQPDKPDDKKPAVEAGEAQETQPKPNEDKTRGIRPDRPE